MSKVTLFTTLDPAVQAIFDDLITLMQQGFPSVNAFGSLDGSGTNLGITLTDDVGNREQYTIYTLGTRVQITPLGVSLGAAETQQYSAAATDTAGQPVAGATFVWSMVAPALGSMDAAGLYTAPGGIAAAASDTIKCTLADGSAWATTSVSLHG